MFNLKLKNTVIRIKFSFLAVIAVLGLGGNTQYILLAVLVCLLHELGHVLFMFIFDSKPEEIIFYAAGIKIVHNNTNPGLAFNILILSAGCITNFLLALLFLAFVEKSFIISVFVIDNIIIGIFNLLPLRYFDGGRIVAFIAEYRCKNTVAIQKIISLISVILIVIFMLYFTFYNGVNYSLLISLLYIIVSELLL